MALAVPPEAGIHVFPVRHGSLTRIFVNGAPSSFDDLTFLLEQSCGTIQDRQGEILEARVFGDLEASADCFGLLREVFGSVDWPLTYVQGRRCSRTGVAGVQLHAVAGSPVRSIRIQGRVVGRLFEDEYASYCVLGDLRPADPSGPRADQARDVIRRLVDVLALAGMGIQDLVRTWFFIDDILDWYSTFNSVRSGIYREAGVFEKYVPASTGIGGSNPSGAALSTSALALRPKCRGVSVRAIPSPLQCPALQYGSSFSRAAEMLTPDCRTVFVSGTASINQEGATVHVGDVDAQIEWTLQVVRAILESKCLDFGDVVWGNAYFKEPADCWRLEEIALRHGLSPEWLVVSHHTVCRPDLLFELEVTAARARESGPSEGRVDTEEVQPSSPTLR